MKKENKCIVMMVITLFVLGFGQRVYSHCQIPCGIFDDPMRFNMIAEDITTIEKSMTEIIALGKEKPVNYNQLVRWIINKDSHADELNEILTYYFMAQRLHPVAKTEKKEYEVYNEQLELLHQMLVASMKCKQTTDMVHVVSLRNLSKKFEVAYFAYLSAHQK